MNDPMSKDVDPVIERQREIFFKALEQPTPAERAHYLDAACGDDRALRAEVELLLKHQSDSGFLERPAVESIGIISTGAVPSEAPGAMIGRYKLLEKLGEGGCGTVYMAEQEEPVRRKVALKINKLGMDTKQVIARFEAERQALALMDHPNIAKFIDADVTGSPDSQLSTPNSQLLLGRPYFVMELVGGIKITDYCNQNQLDTRQRLDLFIQVCRAIQHAHQKGVIHRDIKPSNVLVATQDGVPVPKVIDFGIAKATQGRLTDDTVFTAFEQFLGTPAYMSPEQAQLGSLDVDTRSDIYSLGVLLYELLTGKTPFDAKELLAAGLDAMRRTIQEKEPPTPSTALNRDRMAARSAGSGKSEILPQSGTKSEIDKDLDWIVMKCLEKDRGRRYETANGLAMDLQRHLNNEPVVASPPSRLYRFQKLVRRNKVTAIATAAVALVLVLGILVSTWQAFRATRAERQARLAQASEARERQKAQAAQANETKERQKAQTEAAKSQQVAQFLKDMLSGVGPSKALGRDTTMLKEILDKTAERVGKELTNQPEVEIELRDALAEAYEELALYEPMEQMARQSFRLACALFGEESAAGAQTLRQLGVALRRLGNYLEAERALRRALEIRRKVFGEEDAMVAGSLRELAHVLQDEARFAQAESNYRAALAIYRKLPTKEDQLMADSLSDLATVLDKQGKPTEAEAALREALEIQRELFGDGNLQIARSLHNLSHVLQGQGRLVAAEATIREALALRRKLLGVDHLGTVGSLHNLAGVLMEQGKFAEAEAMYREVLANRRKLLGNAHPDVARSLNNLAYVLYSQDKLAEAEAMHQEALAMRRRLLGNEHPDVAASLNNLANVLAAQGKLAEAVAMFREGLTIARRSFGNEHPNVARTLFSLARLLSREGQLDEAEGAFREALEIRRKVLGNEHPDVATSLDGLCSLLQKQHELGKAEKLAEAEPLARECLAIREKNSGDDWSTFDTRRMLGEILFVQKRYAEAEPLLLSGYEGMKQRESKIPAVSKVRLKEALQALVQLYEVQGRSNEASQWQQKLDDFERTRTNRPSINPPPAKPSP
jgi:serine/threonine protein kinase/tetratricopeptide (TPR) repeat protein